MLPSPLQAASDLRTLEEVKRAEAAGGWRGLLAAAQQHRTLLLGGLVLAALGGYILHQQGVFAAAAAAAQAAAAEAARLWAVAAELFQCVPAWERGGGAAGQLRQAAAALLVCRSSAGSRHRAAPALPQPPPAPPAPPRPGPAPCPPPPCLPRRSKLPLPHIHIHDSEKGLLETIWLLLASVIAVPLICKIPGGSPVLGFLAGGAFIGPYALGIIQVRPQACALCVLGCVAVRLTRARSGAVRRGACQPWHPAIPPTPTPTVHHLSRALQDVESIRHLAELGVVFLLFNIGLELSFDRLRSMGKFVFGMGTLQVGP